VGFLLDTLENLLGLTPDEKQRIAPALPALKQAVDIVDAHLDDLWGLDQHIVIDQPTIKAIFDEVRKLGPNLSLLLGDGWVDISASISSVESIQGTVKAYNATELSALVKRLIQAIDQLEVLWPQVYPALAILIAAAQRRGLTVQSVIVKLKGRSG
jgi:hypothetical protein